MKVFLNHEDKGDFFLVMTPEGGLFLSPEDLAGMGLKDIPQQAFFVISDREYVRLGSIPGLAVDLDREEGVIRITAEPGLLERHVIDLAYTSPFKAERIGSSSAFLNYSVTYDADDDFNFTSLSVPWELGVNIKGFFGFSSFSYTKSNLAERFVRLLSNVTKDDTTRLRRYVAGDFFATSGLLGGSGTFGGVRVASEYSISPNFITTPVLDLTGVATSPSEVEVYVNDSLVRSERFAPGEFEFKNLSQLSGAGKYAIVVKDSFGREQRIERPFYLSSILLKPGLHSYSYNLGFKREFLGQESFEYGGLAFLGDHRYGLSRSLTLGLRGEADNETVNAGPQARFVLWRLGEFNTSAAVSHEDGEYGYGGSLAYLYATRGFSVRGSVKGFTREYSTLNIGPFDDKTRLEWLAGLGFSQRLLGSISGTYSVVNRYVGADTRRTSLFYSRRLYGGLSLNVIATRTKTAGADSVDEVFALLNYFFRNGNTSTFNYRVVDGRSTESINYQKNPPFGPGLSYNFFAERREDPQGDREFGATALVQYRAPFGTYSVNYRRFLGVDSYTLNTSGSVAMVDGSVHLTRTISDSFALVRVGDIKGVTVNYNNQSVGRTGRGGEVIVPDLISYYDNNFSFDAEGLPLNYEVGETTKYASSSFRSGGVIDFKVRRVQAFVGRFLIVEKGEKRWAENADLKVHTDDEILETIVGLDGEFYIENLSPGTYPAELTMGDFTCTTDITIPDSEKVFVDIGEVSCEKD
ncbi:MAG: fimbria/pilus outer membrane usher protein [Thermodesulfobacteriota bacterium]